MIKKMRFKKLFLIIFISYVIVLLVPVLMTGAIYFRSETVVQKQIMESNQAVLRQMQIGFDDRLNSIENLSNQIFLNQNTTNLLYTSGTLNGKNTLTTVRLLNDFASYKNITPFIDNFFVYFSNMDYIVTSSTACKPQFFYDYFVDSQQGYDDWKKNSLLSTQNISSIGTQTVMNLKSGEQVICFWKSVPGAASGKPLGTICIMASSNSFKELLLGVESISGGMAFVLDNNGKAIFTSPHADVSSLPDFLIEIEKNGEIIHKVDNTNYVFIYEESPDTGLKYVTAFPKDVLEAEVGYMRRFAQILIYICVFGALILILALTYRSYKPILKIAHQFDDDTDDEKELNAYSYIEHSVQKITNKNQQFQDAIEKYQPLFRNNFLLKIINGYVTNTKEITEAFDTYSIPFMHEDFIIILIYVENGGEFKIDNSEKERNYVRLILSNISEELAETLGYGCTVETDNDTLCLILNLPPMEKIIAKAAVSTLAERIKSEIERNFSIILTISIGNTGRGYSAIHSSYLDAVNALEYRMIQGISTIIYADELNHTSFNYSYPTDTENHLINYIRSGDYEQAENLLNDLYTENFKRRQLSFLIGKCLFFDIISTAIKLLDMIDVNIEEVFGDFSPSVELLNCSTIDQAQAMLLFIFKQLCDYINDNKKSHNDDLKEKIIRYIEENYADENLSQTLIADHLRISPNYLSNFFHEQVGDKMSHYISSIRTEKAKELLQSTDKNMSQIASAVGFGSDLSLIRVFKKSEGLTPGQYRIQVQKTN